MPALPNVITFRDAAEFETWLDATRSQAHVAAGRFTPLEADAVCAEAHAVATALDRGERWWMPRWSNWKPASGLD